MRLQACIQAPPKCAELRVTAVAQRQDRVTQRGQIGIAAGQPSALGCLYVIGCIAFAGGADDAEQARLARQLIGIQCVQRQCMRTDAGLLQGSGAAFGQFAREPGLARPGDQHVAVIAARSRNARTPTLPKAETDDGVSRQAEARPLPTVWGGGAPPRARMQAAQPGGQYRQGQQDDAVAKPHA